MQDEAFIQMQTKLSKARMVPLKEQAKLSNEILKKRLETILPEAMEKANVDCWIIMGKENCEDPILRTLFTWDMPHAHRISIIVFFYDYKKKTVKRMSLGNCSTEMNKLYENVKKKEESVWECLARIVREYNPKKIAINSSSNYGFCDGISKTLYDSLLECLHLDYCIRFCSAEEVALGWLSKMTDIELNLMETLVEVTQDIISRSFSKERIIPEITCTSDIEWDMRNCIANLGFDYWFGPDVDLQRRGGQSSRMVDTVIEQGDILHCDIGIVGKYIPLHTDIQQVAYVRKYGEQAAPKELNELLQLGNRFQDIVISNFKGQLTGNEIFERSIDQGKKEGLKPMLYTHPLGTFGHGAGPTIGMYDTQGFVKGSGEKKIENKTGYALELNICEDVSEWEGQEIFMYLEEDIYFNDKASFIHGRQTKPILI